MDLGTANTLIIHNDQVVVDEPSIVAIDRTTNKIVAVGKKAMMMHEKTHENLKTIRPLKDGVIADFNAAEGMIREMIKLVLPKKPLFPPAWRMVICIPSSITEVEKRAVRDSGNASGAREVFMIHEPMAAALGIGIDVEEPTGNMIIDIGGGTTGISVIALAGIVCDQSIRIAGDEFTAPLPQPDDRRAHGGADQDSRRLRPERAGDAARRDCREWPRPGDGHPEADHGQLPGSCRGAG